MKTLQTDVAIIGSGPGGYTAAVRLGQQGKKVICIEKEAPGGVCLNIGCIPSKALINAAKYYHKIKHLKPMGISISEENIHFSVKELQNFKQGIVKKFSQGVRNLIEHAQGQFLQGQAKFISPHTLQVQTTEGLIHIEAQAIIIATGSRPIEIPGFPIDNKRIHNSTGGLSFEEVPKSLLLIGGGYIGLELGMVWSKLGSHVTVVESTELLSDDTDAELVAGVTKGAENLGMKVYLHHRALRFEKLDEQGRMKVYIKPKASEDPSFITAIDCDQILCAVGRRPNFENLGLAEIGVAVDEKGFIQVDKQQRTNVSNIYAIGDVCGQPMLAHKASREAEVAAEVIWGRAAEMDAVAIPAVIFTDPEIGTVGLTEEKAKQKGYDVVTGKCRFSILGRALTDLEPEGFVKVVADAKTKQLLGVHILGFLATELVSEATLALEMGALLPDLAWTIHSHPTLAEGIMEAAKIALGESTHTF